MRVYLDYDGILSDLEKHCKQVGLTVEEAYRRIGLFSHLPSVKGAKEGVKQLEDAGHDVWILHYPEWNINPTIAGDRLYWTHYHFPQLVDKVILAKDRKIITHTCSIVVSSNPTDDLKYFFGRHLIVFKDWNSLLQAVNEVERILR